MSNLNKDILFLIFEELQNDRISIYSCLLVNRTWCDTAVPILWKNPGRFCATGDKRNILFDVILLHLSEESRNILENQEIDLFTKPYQRLLFNYISFWRYLNLYLLESMITTVKNIEEPKTSIIRNEILKLFINNHTRFTHIHIYIPRGFNYQLHLIPGAERCFSNLKYLLYDANDNNQNSLLDGLSTISKSIEKLEFYIMPLNNTYYNNSGIINLIRAQKKLSDIRFIHFMDTRSNESFHKSLEESLIEHGDTIQHLQMYWKPVTKILSRLVNLISLDINLIFVEHTNLMYLNWSCLENVTLPSLKNLKVQGVPSKSLISLIENTKGSLSEISINYEYDDNKGLIRAIHQNCPNLKFLGLYFTSFNRIILSELDRLLINCQNLNGLVITSYNISGEPGWNNLFKILTKSSPTNLYKFKFLFNFYAVPKLESVKLLFDNWKGRHPMLLQTVPVDTYINMEKYFDLAEKYKKEGIVKKYDNDLGGYNYEKFEWVHENNLILC